MLKCDKVCPAISTCHHDSIRNSNGCNEKSNGKRKEKEKAAAVMKPWKVKKAEKRKAESTENAGCYYLSSTK